MSDSRLMTTRVLASGPAAGAAPVRPRIRRRASRNTDESSYLRAVVGVAEAIAEALDPAEVARRACDAICGLVPDVDRASVRLFDPARGGAVLLAASGYPGEYADQFAVLPIDASTAVGKAITTGQLVRETDATPLRVPASTPPMLASDASVLASDGRRVDQTLRLLASRCLVVVPLPPRGETAGEKAEHARGVVCVGSPHDALTDGTSDAFWLALGHLLAQALANAQAHVQAQAQARAAEQLTAVLASIEDAVWVADNAGRIVLANAAAGRVGGVEPAEDSYRPLVPWSPLDAPSNFEGQPIPAGALPIARALRGEHFTYLLLRSRSPLTGAEVYLRVAGGPLRDAGGAVVGAVITGNDITRRLMFERQRDALVAATGHDLRNPLAALKASVQLLIRHAVSPGHEYEAAGLARMLRLVNRVTHLVSDLMDVGLLAEQRLTLNRAPMDLVGLACEVVEEEQANVDQRTITFHAADNTLIGDWDRARLERVLTNLIDNAAKFSPAATTITVRIWREQVASADATTPYARVSVADQGQGIAPEHLGRLFEWYFRAPESADQTRGSGIGLAISRELLAAHGGRIWAESAGAGRGSVFHLALPLPPEPARGRRSRSRPPTDPR